jgi:23S rRNA (uracil1939-C5)-methyltransferase
VVYVSCNPANLARDLANIAEKYSVKKMIPVDMFPHTRHLEVVAILKRNKV